VPEPSGALILPALRRAIATANDRLARLRGPRARLAVRLGLTVFVLARLTMVDVAPTVSNDSLGYLKRAIERTPIERPSVIIRPPGYKTSGYPIYLAGLDTVHGWLGGGDAPIDRLTLIAVVHRVTLAVGLVWLAWWAGLWALPVLWVLTNRIVQAQLNILITEGLTVPAAVLYTLAVVWLWQRAARPGSARDPRAWAALLLVAATLAGLVLSRLNLLAMAAPLLAVAVRLRVSAQRRDAEPVERQDAKPPRRQEPPPGSAREKVPDTFSPDTFSRSRLGGLAAWRFGVVFNRLRLTWLAIPVAVLCLATAGYALALCVHNHATHGRFTPFMGKGRVLWWGTHKHVFDVHRDNTQKPELDWAWRRGKAANPSVITHEVEAEHGQTNYDVVDPILIGYSHRLLDDAGVSLNLERGRAFVHAVAGGELTELTGMRNRLLARQGNLRGDPYPVTINRLGRPPPGSEHKADAMLRRLLGYFNHGHMPDTVPGWWPAAFPTGDEWPRRIQGLVMLALLLGLAWRVLRRRVPLWSPYTLTVVAHFACAAAFAIYLIDLWRYMLPTWSAAAVAATLALALRRKPLTA